MLPTITNWRKFHHDNVNSLDQTKVHAAVNFLKCHSANWKESEELKAEAKINPEWWVGEHFSGMMGVRNLLRENKFGEKYFGIDNLDDYAVGLLELALGIEYNA